MAFDPSKPFEVVSEEKPKAKGFDPSKPFERVEAKKQEEGPSKFESGSRGAIQGFTLGFSDELVGGAKGIYDDLKSLFGKGESSDPAPEFDEFGRVSNADKLQGNYKQYRDEERALNKAAQEANPMTYLAGNVAGGLAVPGAGSLGGATAAGALAGVGASDDEDVSGIALDALVGGGLGAGAYGVGKVLQTGLDKFAKASGKAAEGLAENATGATRVQADKFRDNAGRELLDRKLVRFGDTPEKIAERAGAELTRAGESIGNVVKEADAMGARVSTDEIFDRLASKLFNEADADNIALDPQRKALARLVERVYGQGSKDMTVQQSEATKKAFDKMINYNAETLKPGITGARREAANAFREASENAIERVSPELMERFTKDKDTYGLLKPIVDAAEKRASQLNQNPLGGLNDIATAAAGVGVDPTFGAGAVAARRLLAPRAASTGAVVLDNISKIVGSPLVEKMGKFAAPLRAAAARSGGELLVTHQLLLKQDPEYQALLESIANGE